MVGVTSCGLGVHVTAGIPLVYECCKIVDV